jgi:Holliday junction resolvase RusA-like endonuclease
MEQVKFVILGEPKGKGRPRFSRQFGRAYTPKETANYENLVSIEYQIQCNNFRFSDDAMLDMRIMAYYSIPKSKSKRQKNMMLSGLVRPTKKPDMDNVVKIVADSLNQIAYRDDTQIVDCQVRKFFSEEPRVEVVIRKIGDLEVR